MGHLAIFIPFVALSIPIVAIIFAHRQKTQDNKIKELELKKEILELEIKKQDSKILLLEAENRNLDKIINE
ncbi:MAG: hypothetical protein FWC22_07740 [Treponema sp.]|nr:hypothetical protein [Treponema sp.]